MTGTGKGFQGICHTLFLVLCSGLRDKVYLTIYYTNTGKFFCTGALSINSRKWQGTLVCT